jgi:hypothetical protein
VRELDDEELVADLPHTLEGLYTFSNIFEQRGYFQTVRRALRSRGNSSAFSVFVGVKFAACLVTWSDMQSLLVVRLP